jgi:serine/threonine-protein kinase ULK/ATG1
MKHPDGDFVVSDGFDRGEYLHMGLLRIFVHRGWVLALEWFKDHFMKCNERAALVKTWLPAQYSGPKAWLDQLVYDRALVLVSLGQKLMKNWTDTSCSHGQQRERN